MQVKLRQMIVPTGSQLLMTDVSWQMYEEILEEFAENRGTRINYSGGVLEIMVPLPEHEFDKGIISYLVIALLEELNIDYLTLGSTTFKSELMKRGLEADECFYIENEAVIRRKNRIDLSVDPPPDLAIEIDITSRTRLDNYEVLGVKELWRFNGTELEINVLESGKYVRVSESYHFPSFPLHEMIPQCIERNRIDGRNKTMKAFRTWVRERIVAN
jgi:Uma2 family endonuclease